MRARPPTSVADVGCAHASGCLGDAPRPRCLLRLGRAARQALAARQAGRGRWGRRSRGRRHGVLRGPRVRRPLGDVHPRGPLPLPPRGLPHPRFHAYRDASGGDGAPPRGLPLVEPLSLDEAFVDLAVSDLTAYAEDPSAPFVERGPSPRHRGHRRADRVGRGRRRRSSWPRSPATWTSPTAWSWSHPAPSSTCCARCT